jgi:hypothetical protein
MGSFPTKHLQLVVNPGTALFIAYLVLELDNLSRISR